MENNQDSRQRFAALVREHSHSMFRAARAILDCDADAEDAVGEAVLLAWQAFPNLKNQQAARCWLLKITVNCAYGQRRGQRRVVYMDDLSQAAGSAPSPEPSGLWDAVLRLPEDQRLAVMLYYYEDLPVAEIAKTLGVPQGTVKSRLSRGRERLKALLREEEAYGFEDFDTRMKGRAEAEDCPIPQDFEKRLEMRLEELPAQARSKKRLGRRIIAIMAAVLILTGSALAISSTLREQLSRALGLFEPYTTPIESASAVDQGIKVQILSAMADDYTVHIYLEIQDLTGERPMKHILDLLTDSFVPNVDNEIQIRWGGTKLLGYNEKTHTALVDVYTAGEDYRSLRDWNLRIGGISFYSENKVETIYGTWELPFTLTALETRTISLDAGDHSDFHTLKISPIGLVLEGGPDSFPQATEAELIFADGHTESVEQGSGAGVMGQTISSWYFSEPISPDEIVRVELPCWTITLNSEDQGSVTRK